MHINVGHVIAISLTDLFADLQREPFEDAVGNVASDRFQILLAPRGLDPSEGVFDTSRKTSEVKIWIGPLQPGDVLPMIISADFGTEPSL